MRESNKLIAEFMGINLITINDIISNKNPYISSADGYTKEDLQYHNSWDWLIPVVTKCLDIYHIEQMNDDLNFKFYDSMGDIKKTYKAVVEFIKENNDGKDE